jgi:hypothetical protein
MVWFVGLRARIPELLWQRELRRLLVFVPALIVGVLCSAMWCEPDGMAPQPIDSFLLSLHSLETQHARKVRVLHFGDSHIASDTESSVVRTYLQNIFGDGGPGLELPWKGPPLSSLTITYGNSYGWERGHPTYISPVQDTGLSLSYIEAASPNQSAWLEATGSEFRVYYLAQPEGGEAEFLIDGVSLGRQKMNAGFPQLQVARFQTQGPDAPHRFEVRTQDYGRVRILGVSVEKAAPGVVYSALGLVGARAEYLLKCREETFEAQISAEQPDLIIMGYGTNETSGSYLDENAYETALSTIISRMHRAAPSALVILLTPPDRGDSRPGQAEHFERILQEVIAAQRDVAGRDGTVLMDLHAAMGGAGSAERWAAMQPPLARPDMTHFTNEGYNLLGRYIVGGIMKLYDSGADVAGSFSNDSLEGKRLGELLPPLYPGLTKGAILAAAYRNSYTPEASSSPPQIFYFLMPDGQVVVTNDLSMIDASKGKVISPEEAGCLLRGKAAPCDNASRW